MSMRDVLLFAIVAVGVGLAGASPAAAQTFPDHVIKIVVPYPPGGPADVAARLVTQPMTTRLGQSVIIENQPGAGGRTGARAVALSAPDGYTLQLGGTNPNAIAQSLFRNLTFEPVKGFAAVALIAFDSNALVVHPSVPAKTLQELVQYSKANPGKLTSGGHGRASARISAWRCSGSGPAPTSRSFPTRAPPPRSRTCWAAKSRSA